MNFLHFNFEIRIVRSALNLSGRYFVLDLSGPQLLAQNRLHGIYYLPHGLFKLVKLISVIGCQHLIENCY